MSDCKHDFIIIDFRKWTHSLSDQVKTCCICRKTKDTIEEIERLREEAVVPYKDWLHEFEEKGKLEIKIKALNKRIENAFDYIEWNEGSDLDLVFNRLHKDK